MKGTISDTQELSFDLSQGSAFGPIVYCLYTKPPSDITRRFGLLHHSHYIHCNTKSRFFADNLSGVDDCVSEIMDGTQHMMMELM